MKKILIYLQTSVDGEILPVGLELIGEACRLAERAGDTAVYGAAVYGADFFPCGKDPFVSSKKTLETLAGLTGLKAVYAFECKGLESFEALPYAKVIKLCIDELKPDVFLVGGTPEGRAVAPTVAALLNTGATADCTAIDLDADGALLQIRPAFGGGIIAEIITPSARPQIATVRAGVFLRTDKTEGLPLPSVILRRIDCESGCPSFSVLKKRVTGLCAEKFEQKKVIVAIGGGVKSVGDLSVFEELCKKIGASLMCSRVVVERGLLPQSRQIGLSGSCVSPELLIAFGVSGSAEFLSGIKAAKRIIAVNLDKDAPIMKIADEPVINDMYAVAASLRDYVAADDGANGKVQK
ncbi:MAG: electron transfer flavoprotein subunit alpha/FixB family protein [Clostridiales bacterium]|nr:electron transfer flavoprotein subunit alpha/FixB family protein [Clostridiales bacterium]